MPERAMFNQRHDALSLPPAFAQCGKFNTHTTAKVHMNRPLGLPARRHLMIY